MLIKYLVKLVSLVAWIDHKTNYYMNPVDLARHTLIYEVITSFLLES